MNEKNSPPERSAQFFATVERIAAGIVTQHAHAAKAIPERTLNDVFSIAFAFADRMEKIRNGEWVPLDLLTANQPRMIEVHYEDSETGEKTSRMEPMVDYHCPNQPRDYPLNQRSSYFNDPSQDGWKAEHPELANVS